MQTSSLICGIGRVIGGYYIKSAPSAVYDRERLGLERREVRRLLARPPVVVLGRQRGERRGIRTGRLQDVELLRRLDAAPKLEEADGRIAVLIDEEGVARPPVAEARVMPRIVRPAVVGPAEESAESLRRRIESAPERLRGSRVHERVGLVGGAADIVGRDLRLVREARGVVLQEPVRHRVDHRRVAVEVDLGELGRIEVAGRRDLEARVVPDEPRDDAHMNMPVLILIL